MWMHKGVGDTGAVSDAAIQFCQEKNIAVVHGVCPFMYLKPRGLGHALHHMFAKWFGHLPEGA